MPPSATRALRAALMAIVAASLTACADEPIELQRCPALSYGLGTVYSLGEPLVIGGDPLDGTFATSETTGFPLFAGHPLAVPARGGVTIQVTATAADPAQVPAVYLYGPREPTGLFGACKAEVSARGEEPTVTFVVPEDGGGELLVLVGTNPIAGASGGYTVSVACEGDLCDEAACPTLLGEGCETEVCATGFATGPVTVGEGEDAQVLTCPTCTCQEQACGPFQRLVFDACVCDCEVPPSPAPVCGADGRTYQTECFARCHQVAVASAEGPCEAVCPALESCTLECPDGFRLADGCPTCACAGDCDEVPARYRPVCGTDGLTYTNPERLACSAPGVSVAYLGPCLPLCELPECELSCPNGYVPAPEPGAACFECACMEAAAGEEGPLCSGPLSDQYWCSRPRPPVGGAAETGFVEQLAQQRTFIDRCTPPSLGWTAVYGAPCPTGACETDAECGEARQAFAPLLTAAGLDPEAVFASGRIGVACEVSELSAVRACTLDVQRECEADADCPGGACEAGRCRFDCPCLNQASGLVYDPVCATAGEQQATHYNACLALCAGAWPIDYPGACCDERRSVAERRAELGEIETFCQTLGTEWSARVRLDTACPPTPEQCENAEDPELCCKREPSSGS